MHVNGTAPLEASSEEASTSAYSRITVQLQEATENAFAEKRKKKKQPPPCLLHFDDNPKYCTCICYNFDLENRVKYEKKRLQWIHTFDLTRGNAPVKIYILSISQSVPAERERELLNICSQSV